MLSTAVNSQDSAHLINLIFKLIIAVVFIVMNILYQLFWKNSAKADYFAARGFTELPPEKEEYIHKSGKPHHCRCGYDLRIAPDSWRPVSSEIPPRCPKCEREILVDELDLTPTSPAVTAPIEETTAGNVIVDEVAPPTPPKIVHSDVAQTIGIGS